MRLSLRLILPLALSAASLTACHSANAPSAASVGPITQLPRALSADEQAILTGSNNFAFNLFYAIDSAAGADSNVFISPLSASVALGTTTVGAAGSTLSAMQQTLGYNGMSVDSMAASYQSLLALLTSVDTNVTFNIADAIWYQTGYDLLPGFTSTVTSDFNARLQSSPDLSSSAAATAINAWVDTATNGKITNLVGTALPQSVAVFLANAIYFHGNWEKPFAPDQTRDTTFTTGNGSGQTIPMMHIETEYIMPLVFGPGYTAVDIPYGRAAYRMTVILPNTGITLDSVSRAMRDGAWSAIVDSLNTFGGFDVQLSLPKFQLSWSDRLNAPLAQLGMGIAFTDAADFSNLATQPLELDEVMQSTFVNVDETGTTAAAATGVVAVPTAEELPIAFTANHPFLYVIREKFSGAILFIGTYTHPATPSA